MGKINQSRLTFDVEEDEEEGQGFLIGATPEASPEAEQMSLKRAKFDTNLSTTVETLEGSSLAMEGVKRKRATRRKQAFGDEPIFIPRDTASPVVGEEQQADATDDDFGIETTMQAARQKNIELIRQRLRNEDDEDESMDIEMEQPAGEVLGNSGSFLLSAPTSFLSSVNRPERVAKGEPVAEQPKVPTTTTDLGAVPDRRLESVLDEPLVSSSLGVGMTLQFLHSRGRPLALCDGSRALRQREIQLVHYDEFGNSISEKEAYKLLSHRFHGNKSGKNKEEKRLKRLADRNMAQKATITGKVEAKAPKKPAKKPAAQMQDKRSGPSGTPAAPKRPKVFGMK